MIDGLFRDGHPRLTLILQGSSGPLKIEFIVDTGFAGNLALPGHLARQIDLQPSAFRNWMLANGDVIKCPLIDAEVTWEEETRVTEALVLASHPLIGTEFLNGYSLQVQVSEGGEVTVE